MNRIRLGRTEAEVSAVSLGTWPYSDLLVNAFNISVGWSGHDSQKARDAMLKCHDLGINHWDTADVYGDGKAETQVGRLWDRVPRDSVFLASKVGWDGGEYDHFYHPKVIREHLERSLKLLKTDVLDLYYLHHCDFGESNAHLDDALAEFEKAKDAGKFRFLGLSDWDCAKVAALVDRIDPDVVQVYRNVIDDDYVSSGLKAKVDSKDLGVVFFSPLRHGLLTGKYDQPIQFPEGDFRSNVEGFGDAAQINHFKKCVATVGERFPDQDEPVLHALLGAVRSDAETSCAIVGLRNEEQVRRAAKVGAALSEEEAAWVRELYRAWSS